MKITKTIVLPEFELAYVNSPRNGCTSIKWVLVKSLDINFERTSFDSVHKFFNSQAFPEFYLKKNLSTIPNHFEVFTVVRNPFDRFVSGFEGKIKGQDNPVKRKYYRVNREIDFKTFTRKMYQLGLRNLEGHFCEQYRGFRIPQVDRVIVFKNLNEGMQPILDKLNFQDKFPHKNKSDREPYRKYYDKRSRQQVAELYQKDLEKLDYTF